MPLDNIELKALIEEQGKAFEAFKETHAELKKADGLTEEKLARIEKTLDDAVEAKDRLEKKLEAEAKEREELELRMSRRGKEGADDAAAEVKAFNLTAGAEAADRKQRFEPLDEDGYAAYKAAFGDMLRKNDRLLTADQVKAMSVGSDPDGGYLVTPDVNGRIVKKVFETSPIRQIADVITISTDSIEGGEDLDEADAGWVGETDARPETGTPQLGRWKIDVHELYAQPKATQKLLDDAAVDVEGWLGDKVGEKISRMENAAFVVGNGIAKPKGLAAYATEADAGSGVDWGKVGHVISGGAGAFAISNPADKLFDLVGLLKEAYLPNARFLTRRAVVTLIRKFKDSTGQYLWQPSLVLGEPERVAGYPVTRAEDMPALADGSLSLMFGDFRQAYLVVDRTGIRVLRDPYTAKPYVLFYSTKRVGGGVVNFEAYKAMKFATS